MTEHVEKLGDGGVSAAIIGALAGAALSTAASEASKAGDPGGRGIAVTIVNATPLEWNMEPEVPLHGGWDNAPVTKPPMCSPADYYQDGMTTEEASNVEAENCVKTYTIQGRNVGSESLVLLRTPHSVIYDSSTTANDTLVAAIYVKHKTGGHRQAGIMLCKHSTYHDLSKGNDKHGDKIIDHIQKTDNQYVKLSSDGAEISVGHAVGHSGNSERHGKVVLTVTSGNTVTFTLTFSGTWDGADWSS